MNIYKVVEKLDHYKKVLLRLNEAVNELEPNEYVYDAVIRRFEFVYELAWELMKAVIEYKGGGEPKFPRDVFREAFAGGIIDNGEIWLAMMKDRNLTSHTYDEEHAKEFYGRIKSLYIVHFKELFVNVEGVIKDDLRIE